MKVDKDVVQNVAALTKIRLDDGDEADMIKGMSRVLDLAQQLQEVDTTGVEPMAHPLDAVQRLRDDRVTERDNRDQFQSVAPETDQGLYLVPRVVE